MNSETQQQLMALDERVTHALANCIEQDTPPDLVLAATAHNILEFGSATHEGQPHLFLPIILFALADRLSHRCQAIENHFGSEVEITATVSGNPIQRAESFLRAFAYTLATEAE